MRGLRRLGLGLRGSVVIIPPSGGGTALSAPTITRSTGATTYPPRFDDGPGTGITRPPDLIDNDKGMFRWSNDYTFATGVTEGNIITWLAAVTSYDFGLSAILSGSVFMQLANWRGTRPGSLNWSNIVNVGDVVAPTITSSAAPSVTENSVLAHGITWNEGGVPAITGGAQSSLVEMTSITATSALLRMVGNATVDYEVNTSLAVQVTVTDYAGNPTPQNITVTVNDQDEIPSAFLWTDAGAASPSTQYTSNTITMAGLGVGVTSQMVFAIPTGTSGQYQKNGGAWTALPATVSYVNTDTFALRGTTNGSGFLKITATSNGVTDDFDAGVTPVTWDAAWKNAAVTQSGGDLIAFGTVSAGPNNTRATTSKDADTGSGTVAVTLTDLISGGSEPFVGLAASSVTNATECKSSANTVGWIGGLWGYELRRAGSIVAADYGAPFADGDIVSFVLSGGSIQIKKNGVNLGSPMDVPFTGAAWPILGFIDATLTAANFGSW